MTTGGSCSARSTGSIRLRRRTSGESRIRRLCRITGRWGLSSLQAGLRDLARRRKEVDSEARKRFLRRLRSRLTLRWPAVGAIADLAADTDSEVAGISSGAAEAYRVAEWHGGFSAGRPRVADY